MREIELKCITNGRDSIRITGAKSVLEIAFFFDDRHDREVFLDEDLAVRLRNFIDYWLAHRDEE